MIEMVRKSLTGWALAGILLFAGVAGIAAQTPQVQSQEVSDVEGIPVLIKHLPDWENVQNSTTFTNNSAVLKNVLGDRPVLDLVEFSGGTEAAFAPNPPANRKIPFQCPRN